MDTQADKPLDFETWTDFNVDSISEYMHEQGYDYSRWDSAWENIAERMYNEYVLNYAIANVFAR